MSKPWGKIGAWAAEAEQAELEEKQAQQAAASRDAQSYPSLKETLNSKTKKKNKMSLQQFNQSAGSGYGGGSGLGLESKRLTPDEMLALPRGPQERSGQDGSGLSGRFNSFGRAGGSQRDDRRAYGGFDDDGRRGGPQSRVSEYDQPSRADGVDNWGMGKKPMMNSFDRGGRSEGFSRGGGNEGVSRADEAGNWGMGKKPMMNSFNRGGQSDGFSRGSGNEGISRADEVGNWGMGKKPMVNAVDGGNRNTSRYGSLGSGGGNDGVSRADEVDNWVLGKKQQVSAAGPARAPGLSGSGPDRWSRGGVVGGLGGEERTRLVLDKPRSDGVVNESSVSKGGGNRPNPFGAARPREEVLSEKGLDWRKLDMEIEAKRSSSRPGSGQSSRPGSAQGQSSRPGSAQSEHAVVGPALPQGVVKPKVNPFGDAKPREVLLEEKGLDWKKIDLDLERRGVDRPETEVEVNLKVEIDHLKRELEKESASNVNRDSQQVSGQEQTSLHDRLLQKERELEQIAHELDDKVRFVQKPIERPRSGSGRSSAVFERPPSHSGSFEDSRNTEFMQRPRSRGTGDAWPKQRDERRGFQGGRERGFLGSRNVDRSERW